jgi:predicted RNase H-like HicB family nuclease
MGPANEFRVCLPAVVRADGTWIVSECPILDVVSQGETQKGTFDNLIDAVRLFLLSCYDRGTLAAVLRERGFTQETTELHAPDASAHGEPWQHIDVSVALSVSPTLDSTRCPA